MCESTSLKYNENSVGCCEYSWASFLSTKHEIAFFFSSKCLSLSYALYNWTFPLNVSSFIYALSLAVCLCVCFIFLLFFRLVVVFLNSRCFVLYFVNGFHYFHFICYSCSWWSIFKCEFNWSFVLFSHS